MDGNGNVEFKEEDGIDYAPVTVQMPGGERVPFLFTIKELNAKGSLEGFGGDFVVPSYRGSSFLDPKVARRSGGTRAGHWPCLGTLAAAALPHGGSKCAGIVQCLWMGCAGPEASSSCPVLLPHTKAGRVEPQAPFASTKL